MLCQLSYVGGGAGDGSRTRDNQLGRLELYQLSYSRVRSIEGVHGVVVQLILRVEGEGFEPSKPVATDLQSVPFDRSGTRPGESTDLCERGILRRAALLAFELAKGLEPATC